MRYFSVISILVFGDLVRLARLRLIRDRFTLYLLRLVESHHCFEDVIPVFDIRSYSCIVI